jgi:hypothetical protein
VNTAVTNLLQSAAAAAGAVGAYQLGRSSVQQYRKKGLQETGSAFVEQDRQRILDQYTKSTQQPAPKVVANLGGSSYSSTKDNVISLSFPSASKFTLGHELGHQSIGRSNDSFRWIQENTYKGLNPNVVGLATVGVGAMVPSMRRATTLALGMNYLNHSGRIISEIEASRRGTKLLNQAGYSVSPAPGVFQSAAYATTPAMTALGGLAAGRFLRSFKNALTEI